MSNAFSQYQYLIYFVVAAAIIYLIKKQKKKRNTTPAPTKRIALNFEVDLSIGNYFIAGMKMIKRGNKSLWSKISLKTRSVKLVSTYAKDSDGKIHKDWIATAVPGGDEIIFHLPAIKNEMEEWPGLEIDLVAKVTTHEYLHETGMKHGEAMTKEQYRLVDSFGGQVNWPTS